MGETMKVVFYGRLAEAIGPAIEIDAASGCSIAGLRRKLAAEYPEAASTLTSRCARAVVGASMVDDDFLVGGNDRIEFLPPVSGG
jgi:molybdopterin converting factor small subunit